MELMIGGSRCYAVYSRQLYENLNGTGAEILKYIARSARCVDAVCGLRRDGNSRA